MQEYRCLNKQVFSNDRYTLVPIRFEDRYEIMQWRNEQIYHLRQDKPLTKEDQDAYFENVVAKLFNQDQPKQILFSFLEDDKCIGYGGLVHINWIDKNAELSFIMDTSLEKDRFKEIWSKYLTLIEEVAFKYLDLHKIFTYAFDLRPHLYQILLDSCFFEDARLNEHCILNEKAFDVVIHSKINSNIYLSLATQNDVSITFKWANDERIRKFSFTKNTITFEEHKRWFYEKLSDPNCYYYILKKGIQKIGSIRIDYNKDSQIGLISYLIDSDFHGHGYGTMLLALFEDIVKTKFDFVLLNGMVMKSNLASAHIFNKLKYNIISESEEILTFSKKIKHETRFN